MDAGGLRHRGQSLEEDAIWMDGGPDDSPLHDLSSIAETSESVGPGISGSEQRDSHFPTVSGAPSKRWRRTSSQFWDEVTQHAKQQRPEPLRRTLAHDKAIAAALSSSAGLGVRQCKGGTGAACVSKLASRLGGWWALPDNVFLVFFPICSVFLLFGLVAVLIDRGVSENISDGSWTEAEMVNPLLRQQKAQTSERAVVTSLLLAVVVLMANIVGFACLRKHLPNVFSPMATPQERAHGLFQIIRSTLSATDEQFLERAGFDAYMVMRLPFLALRFCFYSFCPWGMIAMGVSYWWQENEASKEDDSTQVVGFLDGLSLSALPPGSDMLWIYVPLAYIVTAITAMLIHDEDMIFIRLRRRFVSQPRVEDFSVLVVDIPREYRSNAALFGLFDSMYPGKVHCACVVPDTLQLRARISRAKKLRDNIEKQMLQESGANGEDAISQLKARVNKQSTLQMQRRLDESVSAILAEQALLLQQMGEADRAVDMIMKRRITAAHLSSISAESIKTEFTESLSAVSKILGSKKSCKYGFVSFNNLRSATIARQVLHDSHVLGFSLTVHPAPAPGDVHWRNLTRNAKERHNAAAIGLVLEAILLTFWMVPVVTAMSLVSAVSLSENIPFLGPLIGTPLGAAIVEGAVPALLLSVVMLILPLLLTASAMYESSRSHTDVEKAVVLKYFFFLFLNIFVVTTFGGTIFDSVKTITDNPREIPYIMGVTLPTRAKFFLSYILLDGVVYYTGLLMQWVPLLVSFGRSCCTRNPTPRQKDEWAANREPPDNIYSVPKMLMYLVLAQNFALLAPLVVPAAAVVFGVGYIVYKYMFLQVYEQRGSSNQRYDSGGLLWISVVKCVVMGVICSHLTLMAVLTLKQGWWQMVTLLPLPVLSTLAHDRYGRKFERAARYMPLMECINLDHSIAGRRTQGVELEMAYRQSCLDPAKVTSELVVDQRIVGAPVGSAEQDICSGTAVAKSGKRPALLSEVRSAAGGGAPDEAEGRLHPPGRHQSAHQRCDHCGASTAMHGTHFSHSRDSKADRRGAEANAMSRMLHPAGSLWRHCDSCSSCRASGYADR